MSLYPSLEDMKVDQLGRAQAEAFSSYSNPPPYNPGTYNAGAVSVDVGNAYPSLGNYMGLELSELVIKENMPEYLQHQQISIYQQVFIMLLLIIFTFFDLYWVIPAEYYLSIHYD
ncbi:syntenin-1-like [Sitophilus oryzae]|uniref:Syntenin-1-like n=1 Tax=Sitophilus oryzae TaxID=7048 RepID=A0A6J2YA76_SITOR|nr:syntenin-1-like [Sitophilus oryzae]